MLFQTVSNLDLIMVTSGIYGAVAIAIIIIDHLLLLRQQLNRNKIIESGNDAKKFLKGLATENILSSLGYILVGLLGFVGVGLNWYKTGGMYPETNLDEFAFFLGGAFIIGYGVCTIVFHGALSFQDIYLQGDKEIHLMKMEEINHETTDDMRRLSLGRRKTDFFTDTRIILLFSVILHPVIVLIRSVSETMWSPVATILLILVVLFTIIYFVIKKRRADNWDIKYRQYGWEFGEVVLVAVIILSVWALLQFVAPEEYKQYIGLPTMAVVTSLSLLGVVFKNKRNRNKQIEKYCFANPTDNICKNVNFKKTQ